MNADYDLKQEQLNKSSLISSKNFLEKLLDMWTKHVVSESDIVYSLGALIIFFGFFISLQTQGSGALVLSAMLDFLTFALCVPYSETTDGKQFDILLEMVAGRGRSLFRLFQVTSHRFI